MKTLSVVGARPQFIKAAVVSRATQDLGEEVLVHTGQHYDFEMSQIFFDQLKLKQPDYNLGIGSGSHGFQTGKMLGPLEEVMVSEKPDVVLVYGDTNSTLAGSLVAAKLSVRSAHVEAGLRSFNRRMPEELNRIVADRLSDWLFCPSRAAIENLDREGLAENAFLTGDVMLDALGLCEGASEEYSALFEKLGVAPGEYQVLTVHRQENTQSPDFLKRVIEALAEMEYPTVFPAHPRSVKLLEGAGLTAWVRGLKRLVLVEPLGYMEMLLLMKRARRIITDSGGMQKEAYYFRVPCITLRAETEWVETVEAGWNRLVGDDIDMLREAVEGFEPPREHPELYGGGEASKEIARLLGILLADN